MSPTWRDARSLPRGVAALALAGLLLCACGSASSAPPTASQTAALHACLTLKTYEARFVAFPQLVESDAGLARRLVATLVAQADRSDDEGLRSGALALHRDLGGDPHGVATALAQLLAACVDLST